MAIIKKRIVASFRFGGNKKNTGNAVSSDKNQGVAKMRQKNEYRQCGFVGRESGGGENASELRLVFVVRRVCSGRGVPHARLDAGG